MSDFAAPNPSPATLGSARTQTANGSAPAPHKKARSTANLSLRQQRVRAIWINAMLWTFQGWLAMFYAGAAFAKLTVPYDQLVLLLGWPAQTGLMPARIVGMVEALIVITMLAPLTGLRHAWSLVRAGAVCLLVFEAGYLAVHLMRFEIGLAFINVMLAAITLPLAIKQQRYFNIK